MRRTRVIENLDMQDFTCQSLTIVIISWNLLFFYFFANVAHPDISSFWAF